MSRPTDEITGKVVAKQYGHDDSTHFYRGKFYYEPDKYRDVVEYICEDPRTNTDAALKLLGWLEEQGLTNTLLDFYRSKTCPDIDGACFEVETDAGVVMLPISGEAFRYAVVKLAADVLRVG